MRAITHSRRVVAAMASIAVLAAGFVVTTAAPALAGTGPDVSYPLRHSFSMAPGISGAGRHEPTSCWDVGDGENHYYCRLVAGVEETGDKRNFYVRAADALDNGDDPTYGHVLVARDGIQYEGCRQWRNGDWFCDYQTRSPVSHRHYQDNGFVLNVFWHWARYTGDQASCALALSGVWSGLKGKSFILLLNDCKNGPM